MTAPLTLREIDQDSILAVLQAPSSAEAWDLAGQNFIRVQDVKTALHSFRRSELAGPPFPPNYLYRLAMALEINQDFRLAATRYIRVYEEQSEHSRNALYRAVGCLFRTKCYAEISSLLAELSPSEWAGFDELGLIGGQVFSQQGDIARAISWLLIEPGTAKRGSSHSKLLDHWIESRGTVGRSEDAERLLLLSAHRMFASVDVARKILRWIIRSGHSETLSRLLTHPLLIKESKGLCLHHASIFFDQIGWKESSVRAARMALINQPDNSAALSAILPNQNESNTSCTTSMVLWAKTAIIQCSTDGATVNGAVILLKTADIEGITVLYLLRAAARFKATPTLLYNIGSHFSEKALPEFAVPILKRAVILNPDYGKAWSAYTVAVCTLLECGRGVVSSTRALVCDPNLQSGYTNLAMAYRGIGNSELAIEAGKQQLRVTPNDAVARMGVAFNQLTAGAIEEGFDNYRSRWAQKNFPSRKRPFPQAEWALQKIPKDQKVLIYMEQGMGDEFMFSWFLHFAEERAPGQIVVECDPRLIKLFERSFPTMEFWPMTVPVQQRLLAADILYKIPIGHLPSTCSFRLRALIRERWGLAQAPCVSGYGWILPDLNSVAQWRDRLLKLGAESRMCIGIAWRSGNMTRARVGQYLSPSEIARSLPDNCIAVVLQYVYDEEEIAEICRLTADRGIDVVVFDDLDLKNDLGDVLDLCAALDIIVTPLISTAFMGGAVGTPTWVFRSSESRNIWQQLGTPNIPWIPAIRLFFRSPRESWGKAIDSVRHEIEVNHNWIVGNRVR